MENQTLVTEICPTTTQKWIAEGATLVDVREKEEVTKLRFIAPKILYIPLSEFENRFHELPKNEKLVMVCEVGSRSLRAAGFLINHGYDNVVNMKHGLKRWVERGFVISGDPSVVLNNEDGSCCSSSGCC